VVTAAPLRVLVVDDSAYNRKNIADILTAGSDEVEVVGKAGDGDEALRFASQLRPDVITLDLEMPRMDGFTFLRILMSRTPVSVIVISSYSQKENVFKALELGALDFIAKPGGRVSPRLEEIQKDLVTKVLQIAEVRMDNLRRRVQEEEPPAPPASLVAETCAKGIELVAIGCSTGGPPAIQHLFQALPLLPVPFVVAQHMPQTFTRLFAERVNKLTTYEVREGRDGDMLLPGFVTIAPGGMQSEVRRIPEGLQLRVFPAAANDLYAPSVDRLFRAASEACKDRLIAVVLTGMGDDGSEAIRDVRERGGKTIAESSQSAIIFGMPAEAIKTGAVDEVVSLNLIPEAIRRLCM
jgi:two-component system chemotaxis response regulator CheB